MAERSDLIYGSAVEMLNVVKNRAAFCKVWVIPAGVSTGRGCYCKTTKESVISMLNGVEPTTKVAYLLIDGTIYIG